MTKKEIKAKASEHESVISGFKKDIEKKLKLLLVAKKNIVAKFTACRNAEAALQKKASAKNQTKRDIAFKNLTDEARAYFELVASLESDVASVEAEYSEYAKLYGEDKKADKILEEMDRCVGGYRDTIASVKGDVQKYIVDIEDGESSAENEELRIDRGGMLDKSVD